MPRRKKKDDPRSEHERQKHFLQAYEDSLSVDRAAEVANVDRASHYRWLRKNPRYVEAFDRRREIAARHLETEAVTRAGEGWLEPIYYQGSECGQVRRFDSGLLQFLLRGLMPSRYGSKTEISGPAGEPVQARIEVVFVRPGEISPKE